MAIKSPGDEWARPAAARDPGTRPAMMAAANGRAQSAAAPPRPLGHRLIAIVCMQSSGASCSTVCKVFLSTVLLQLRPVNGRTAILIARLCSILLGERRYQVGRSVGRCERLPRRPTVGCRSPTARRVDALCAAGSPGCYCGHSAHFTRPLVCWRLAGAVRRWPV